MARMIKYAAQCFYCKKWCAKGQAYLHRQDGKWYCHCHDCYKKSKDVKNGMPTQ